MAKLEALERVIDLLVGVNHSVTFTDWHGTAIGKAEVDKGGVHVVLDMEKILDLVIRVLVNRISC